MTLHHFYCVRLGCGLYTTDVLKASVHEFEHDEIRKIGTTIA